MGAQKGFFFFFTEEPGLKGNLSRMGSESIAHEAEGRMGYWLRGHEGERNNCFSKIQLFGQKYWDKTTLAS